jgi:hypothetical protein
LNQKETEVDIIIDKCWEELDEVETEILLKKPIERQLSEAWDLLQASFSLLNKISDGDKKLLEESNRRHVEKLLGRGWKVEGELVLIMSLKENNG